MFEALEGLQLPSLRRLSAQLQQLLVVTTAVAASIGSPATPGVGMVILAMVLSSVGIPSAGVVLLLGVDRILDTSRTVINVMGDLTTCILLERFGATAAPTQVAQD